MMTQSIKAIETVYKGYRFRSRLEARWAVSFDVMGLSYRYEPEGFALGPDLNPSYYEDAVSNLDLLDEGRRQDLLELKNELEKTVFYLPDFYLPNLGLKGTFVEVKGVLSKEDEIKIKRFANLKEYDLIILEDIPFVDFRYVDVVENNPVNGLKTYYTNELVYGDEAYGRTSWDYNHCFCECPVCGKIGFEYEGRANRINCKCQEHAGWLDKLRNNATPKIAEAFEKARQARFEHGESPNSLTREERAKLPF